jgi:acetyl esterase/lipase
VRLIKSWRWIPALLVSLLILLFHSQIRIGVLTALFLVDLLQERSSAESDGGSLAWFTSSPSVETLQIPRAGRTFPADLYYIKEARKQAAILLTHGIIETGKDDPRLVRFARSLARCGFAVVVPELQGMKTFRILLTDVDDIVETFRAMASLTQTVDPQKLGVMGFSYGAGPTLMAAASPAIREQVKFAVSFGGYYDPINVIRFITTGIYEYGSERGFVQPEVYGKWIFFMNNAEYVGNENDRRVLRDIFEKESKKEKDEAARRVGDLSDRGRYLYELLNTQDPARIDDLIRQTDTTFQEYLRKISMAPIIPALKAYLIVGHGSTDPLIPYTESLRLADAVPDKSRVHVAILRLFSHVDPSRNSVSLGEFVTTYVPSLVRFYFLVYDLLRQQT